MDFIYKIEHWHNPENHIFVLQNKMHLFIGGSVRLTFMSVKSQLLFLLSEFHAGCIKPNTNLFELANSICPQIIHLKLFNNDVINSNSMV
jgi:hypothetical protein